MFDDRGMRKAQMTRGCWQKAPKKRNNQEQFKSPQ